MLYLGLIVKALFFSYLTEILVIHVYKIVI